ncbi:hypothetical protein ACTHQY_09025 [Rhodococcoides corynebacterioides]|uniref:hypothetical protein n=1 Tax=Rhodococcoides corynebacterioides TaxID=53972 RepID=UPI003F7E118C
MTIDVVTCRGLFEPDRSGNMLSNLTRHLDSKRFSWSEFPVWGAGFGDYDRELDRVSTALAQHIRNHQGPLVGAGYSGGSHVWKRAMLRLSGDDLAKVIRLVLCADPSMPGSFVNKERMWGTRRFGANGIAGAEPLWLDGGVDYVCDQGDPICFTPTGSPLRTLAAFLTSMGPDAGMPARMRVKLAAAAVDRRYDLAAYAEANRLFGDYAFRGAHTRPYPALLARVADDINRTVTR